MIYDSASNKLLDQDTNVDDMFRRGQGCTESVAQLASPELVNGASGRRQTEPS